MDDNIASTASAPPPLSRKISHHNSGIHEPQNIESDEDGFVLSVLNPSDNRVSVWLARLFLFWGIFFVVGFYITFGSDPNYWSIGVGAAVSYVLCIGLYLLEAYWIVPWWYRNEVGLPMVHWLSWAVFLDIIYHVVNPRNLKDCRAEFTTAPVLSEDETPRGEFWLDFVADVGDGFNPTFAVFSSMARSTLDFGTNCQLPRANAVVVGGDVCYPWPRHEDIMARFLRPLSWAYPEDMADEKRNMYIMPGNHEWADGLRNFRRLILNRKSIGGWTVKNKTPYFAVKLPHGWWMFCVDPGNELCQDMDATQVEYFTRLVAEQTKMTDRFILCVHEPDWIKNNFHGFALFKQIAMFRHNVLGDRLRLSLAGDLHYYRRMEEVSGNGKTKVDEGAPFPSYVTSRRQLVVAGNGGAFSHPTFIPDASSTIHLGEPHLVGGPQYRTVCNHPTVEESQKVFLTHWTNGFSFGKNHGFGSILALVYVGMCLAVSPLDYSPDGLAFPTGIQALNNASYLLTMLKSFWFYPSLLFLAVMLFIVATTSAALRTFKSKCTSFSMAIAHITAHLLSAFMWRKFIDAAFAEALSAAGDVEITFANTVLFCFLSNTALFAVAFFWGPAVTAVYMYASAVVVRNAYNEPMSTIEYQEDKGFLRMKISPDSIDLFTIGLRQVPREWKERPDSQRTNESPSHFASADLPEVEPFVVERITISRGGSEIFGSLEQLSVV